MRANKKRGFRPVGLHPSFAAGSGLCVFPAGQVGRSVWVCLVRFYKLAVLGVVVEGVNVSKSVEIYSFLGFAAGFPFCVVECVSEEVSDFLYDSFHRFFFYSELFARLHLCGVRKTTNYPSTALANGMTTAPGGRGDVGGPFACAAHRSAIADSIICFSDVAGGRKVRCKKGAVENGNKGNGCFRSARSAVQNRVLPQSPRKKRFPETGCVTPSQHHRRKAIVKSERGRLNTKGVPRSREYFQRSELNRDLLNFVESMPLAIGPMLSSNKKNVPI